MRGAINCRNQAPRTWAAAPSPAFDENSIAFHSSLLLPLAWLFPAYRGSNRGQAAEHPFRDPAVQN